VYKKELRKIYKQKRKELTENQIKGFQKSIYSQVLNSDFSQTKSIHIFLPIENQKEINTYPIIQFLREQDKQIIISKSCFKTSTLSHFVFDDNIVLEINKYGIPEPVNAKEFDVKEIDLVFVPMLVSDQLNYRVGYGKGFYDRFLSDCKQNIKTIGLNFFAPIPKIKDVDSFDIALDEVIYPLT